MAAVCPAGPLPMIQTLVFNSSFAAIAAAEINRCKKCLFSFAGTRQSREDHNRNSNAGARKGGNTCLHTIFSSYEITTSDMFMMGWTLDVAVIRRVFWSLWVLLFDFFSSCSLLVVMVVGGRLSLFSQRRVVCLSTFRGKGRRKKEASKEVHLLPTATSLSLSLTHTHTHTHAHTTFSSHKSKRREEISSSHGI